MRLVIIILIVLAVLLLAGLIWSSTKRKKDQVARERASELRSDAAQTASQHREEEAKARESQAEAERARAEADRLDARAQEQQTSVAQTRAQHEDRLREADRVDPDVDHRADDYQPGAHNAPAGQGSADRTAAAAGTGGVAGAGTAATHGDHDQRDGYDDQHLGRDDERGGSTAAFTREGHDGDRDLHQGQVNPPPSGPETSVPDEAYERGYQDGQDPGQTYERPRPHRDDV